jgi:hypothetical protein
MEDPTPIATIWIKNIRPASGPLAIEVELYQGAGKDHLWIRGHEDDGYRRIPADMELYWDDTDACWREATTGAVWDETARAAIQRRRYEEETARVRAIIRGS